MDSSIKPPLKFSELHGDHSVVPDQIMSGKIQFLCRRENDDVKEVPLRSISCKLFMGFMARLSWSRDLIRGV
jgi:hypothetical protein